MPRMNYEVPEEVHRRAKIAAATHGVTLQHLMIRGLELATQELENAGKS